MVEERNEYVERTVTTNAWMLEELLRSFIGDPYELFERRPMGRGYWGEANDQGVPITDEGDTVVAFVAWPQLRQLVDGIRAARINNVQRTSRSKGLQLKPQAG
jgi:hypothetical protein